MMKNEDSKQNETQAFLNDLEHLIQFPGGEPHVTQNEPLTGIHYALSRGGSAYDMVSIMMWGQAVRQDQGVPVLFLPYLPGARADKVPRQEANIYSQMINASSCEQVIALDPHSSYICERINNLVILEAADVVKELFPVQIKNKLVGIIAPDAGAKKRASLVAESLGLPVFQAYKHRDFITGTLSGFSCDPLPEKGDLLIVDDICDGGGTFMGLASAIPTRKGKLHLYVSHGIFSGKAEQLVQYYESIITTNSHPGCYNLQHLPQVQILDIDKFLYEHFQKIGGF